MDFIEVTKDSVREKYADQISDRKMEQLWNKQIPLIIVLWIEYTSLEASKKNQVSIYMCGSNAYIDKHYKFREWNFLRRRRL